MQHGNSTTKRSAMQACLLYVLLTASAQGKPLSTLAELGQDWLNFVFSGLLRKKYN